MKSIRLASYIIAFGCTSLCQLLHAQTPRAAEPSRAAQDDSAPQKLEVPGLNLIQGPTIVKLGSVAELKLAEGFAFVGPDSLDKFFEMTHNIRGGNEVGVVLSPEGWMLYFDYNETGFVKDDDKASLDAAKLYQSLEQGQTASNENRKSKGWSELKLRGWETEPHYDEKTNHLKWAFKISSSSDEHQSVGINESIRLLGRAGVMEVTLVGDLAEFRKNEAQTDSLLNDFHFLPGSKYSEFKPGDKVAKYGLAALVVGGAGVMAAKAGLLGKLGALFAKAGKVIIVGLVAAGAAVAKLWKKIIGKDKVE